MAEHPVVAPPEPSAPETAAEGAKP